MSEEMFNKAVSSSVALLWTKRNKPEDSAAVVKVWKRILGRNAVSPREIGEATDHFLESSPFFPDVSEILRWILVRRDEKPRIGVLNADGTVRLCLAEDAEGHYRDQWGSSPTLGFAHPPTRVLPARAKALPEPKAKTIGPLDDPEQEQRVKAQIDEYLEAKSAEL